MPKQPIDYSKTIIYKLVCNDLNIKELYVGHTTDFKSRKRKHKCSIENFNDNEYNTKKALFIREHGGWSNWTMIEIEKCPCNDKREACSRERYWYEELNAKLNSYTPLFDGTNQEYQEDYRIKHKEQMATYYKKHNKDYYIQHREQLLIKHKKKYTCECGSTISCGGKSLHLKTLKHCQSIESQNNSYKQSLLLDPPIGEIILETVEPNELTNV